MDSWIESTFVQMTSTLYSFYPYMGAKSNIPLMILNINVIICTTLKLVHPIIEEFGSLEASRVNNWLPITQGICFWFTKIMVGMPNDIPNDIHIIFYLLHIKNHNSPSVHDHIGEVVPWKLLMKHELVENLNVWISWTQRGEDHEISGVWLWTHVILKTDKIPILSYELFCSNESSWISN